MDIRKRARNWWWYTRERMKIKVPKREDRELRNNE